MAKITLTLDGELNRQLKAVRRGETDKVVCPWCGAIGSSDCCVELADARERLSRTALERIGKQARSIRSGIQIDPSIECPYCDGINRPENATEDRSAWKRPNVSPYCCDLFFSAVMRLADHQVVQNQIDHARRIQDNLAKVSVN